MQFCTLLVFAIAAVSANGAAIRRDLEGRGAPKPTSITITGTGATSVASNHLGCAHITPAGQNAQLICTNTFTATGFTINVKDEKTAARQSCVITGLSGTCGPSGAGATISNFVGAPAGKPATSTPTTGAPPTSAPASGKPIVTITGPGAKDVGGNVHGCAHITPAGQNAQLVCTNNVTAAGFTISIKDEKTAARLSCNIVGTSGTCGPSGAGATITLPKSTRDVKDCDHEATNEDDVEEDDE